MNAARWRKHAVFSTVTAALVELQEIEPTFPLEARLHEVATEWRETGQWQLTHAELGFGARLAWRQAERCVGRLYWKGLELFESTLDLATPSTTNSAEEIADALFEHLRFAFNGGDLRPAISVFNPGRQGVRHRASGILNCSATPAIAAVAVGRSATQPRMRSPPS